MIQVIERYEPAAWHFGVRLKVENKVTIQDLQQELRKERRAKVLLDNNLKSLQTQVNNLNAKVKKLKADLSDLEAMSTIVCPTCNVAQTYSAAGSRQGQGRKAYKCAQAHIFHSARQRG